MYGNSQGLGLLEDMNELRRDMIILKSKMDALTTRDAKREAEKKESSEEILALKGKVARLAKSSESYLAIRRRYIAVYQRDFKGRDDLKGSDAVKGGNVMAHEGDAVADATVFDRDGRLETGLYEELYGLPYTKVLEWNGMYNIILLCKGLTKCIDSGIEDGGLFRVLNAYATTVTQGTTSQELTRAFHSFIDRVKENWLQAPNQEEPNTPLSFAYYTFWDKHKESANRQTR